MSEAWANYGIFPTDIAKLDLRPDDFKFEDNISLIDSPYRKNTFKQLGSGIVIFSKNRSHFTGISIDTNWNTLVEKTLRERP